jgi:hypothetical protein
MAVTLNQIWHATQQELLVAIDHDDTTGSTSMGGITSDRIRVAQIYARAGNLSQEETSYVNHPNFARLVSLNHVDFGTDLFNERVIGQLVLEVTANQFLNEYGLGSILHQFNEDHIRVAYATDCNVEICYLKDLHIPNDEREFKATVLSSWSDDVCSLCQLSDGRIVSGSLSGELRIWDIEVCRYPLSEEDEGEERCQVLRGHDYGIAIIAEVQTADDHHFLVSVGDDKILVWDLSTYKIIYELVGLAGSVFLLAQGKGVIIASDAVKMLVWNLNSVHTEGEIIEGSNIFHPILDPSSIGLNRIDDILVLSDGRLAVVEASKLLVHDLTTNVTSSIPFPHNLRCDHLQLIEVPGKLLVFYLRESSRINVYDLLTLELENVIETGGGGAYEVTRFSDGTFISNDRDYADFSNVYYWKLLEGKVVGINSAKVFKASEFIEFRQSSKSEIGLLSDIGEME